MPQTGSLYINLAFTSMEDSFSAYLWLVVEKEFDDYYTTVSDRRIQVFVLALQKIRKSFELVNPGCRSPN